jgi:phage gpG-like protein
MAQELFAKWESKKAEKFYKSIETKLKWLDQKKAKQWGKVVSIPVFKDIMHHFKKEEGPRGKWQKHSASTVAVWAGRVSFRKIGGRVVPFKDQAIHDNSEFFKDPLAKDARPKRLGGKLLQDEGRLRKTIRPNKFKTWRSGWQWFTKVKTKTGFPYAAAHNNNDPARDTLPQREFMWLSKKGLKQVRSVSFQYLLNGKTKR